MTSTIYFPETKTYPYKRTWNLKTIWELSNNLETKKIEVSKLWNERYADAWCWQHESEIINNSFFLHHMSRVLKADLNYPIILSEEEYIFDGVHRLVKAKYLDMQYIDYVQFSQDPQHNNS